MKKTPREAFLPKFQAGKASEKEARDEIAKEAEVYGDGVDEYVDEGWDKEIEEIDRLNVEGEDQRVERSFNSAIDTVKDKFDQTIKYEKVKKSKFQFVGVVQPIRSSDSKKVRWYARKRPSNSKWNIRLVHVNREAIVKDLFARGKIDIYGEYENTGKKMVAVEGENMLDNGKQLITGKYSVKKRNLWNIWNFNPKHFFTDSSGAFWRERRLSPGLYSDGLLVYESAYRYSDGKNGMKPIARLESLLESTLMQGSVGTKLLKRFEEDSPDVVLEE